MSCKAWHCVDLMHLFMNTGCKVVLRLARSTVTYLLRFTSGVLNVIYVVISNAKVKFVYNIILHLLVETVQ